eukprot:s1855_g6.t1
MKPICTGTDNQLGASVPRFQDGRDPAICRQAKSTQNSRTNRFFAECPQVGAAIDGALNAGLVGSRFKSYIFIAMAALQSLHLTK